MVEIDIGVQGKVYRDYPFDKFNTKLAKGPIVITLDPSSSQSGVAVGTEIGELIMIADVKNKSRMHRDMYADYLTEFIRGIASNNEISKFIYEVPFATGKKDAASLVLGDLENIFKRYNRLIPNLKKENMYPILPAVWRKHFFNRKEYVGMRNKRDSLKMIAREECVRRHPEYTDYWSEGHYIKDSTDAVGILDGFMEEYYYDRKKLLKRVSKVNSRFNKNHKYSYQLITGTTEELIIQASLQDTEYSLQDLYVFNSELTLEENIEIATASHSRTVLLIAIDEKSRMILRWKTDETVNEHRTVGIICSRKNEVKENEYTKSRVGA